MRHPSADQAPEDMLECLKSEHPVTNNPDNLVAYRKLGYRSHAFLYHGEEEGWWQVATLWDSSFDDGLEVGPSWFYVKDDYSLTQFLEQKPTPTIPVERLEEFGKDGDRSKLPKHPSLGLIPSDLMERLDEYLHPDFFEGLSACRRMTDERYTVFFQDTEGTDTYHIRSVVEFEWNEKNERWEEMADDSAHHMTLYEFLEIPERFQLDRFGSDDD